MFDFFHAKITLELWEALAYLPGFAMLSYGLLSLFAVDSSPNSHSHELSDKVAKTLSPSPPPLPLTEQQKAFLIGVFTLPVSESIKYRLRSWVKSPWFTELVSEGTDFDEWCHSFQSGIFDKQTMMHSTRNFGPVSLKHLETAIEQYLVQKNAQNITGDDR